MNIGVYGESIFWLIALVLFCVIEGVTIALVCMWFAGGAIAALIACMIGFSFTVQVVVFVVVSALLLLLLRPFVKKVTSAKKTRMNSEMVIGQEGIVIQQIDPINGTGQVKVIGQVWSAKPEDGKSIIEVDKYVEVMGISGVKVIVRPKADGTPEAEYPE